MYDFMGNIFPFFHLLHYWWWLVAYAVIYVTLHNHNPLESPWMLQQFYFEQIEPYYQCIQLISTINDHLSVLSPIIYMEHVQYSNVGAKFDFTNWKFLMTKLATLRAYSQLEGGRKQHLIWWLRHLFKLGICKSVYFGT